VILAAAMPYAWAGGGIPCGLFLEFDKFVFSNERTIPIKIEDVCEQYEGKTIRIIVSNPDRKFNEIAGSTIYYNQQISITGKTMEVTFAPPQETMQYAFLVTLRDDSIAEITDEVIIFTKEDADIIKISDILVPQKVSAGSELVLSAKLEDGLGNPVPPIVRILAIFERPVCGSGYDVPSILELELKKKEKISETTQFEGRLTLPSDFASGLYKVEIIVFSDPSDGYKFPGTALSQIQVENGSIPVTTLFYNMEEPNGNIFSKIGGDIRYALGDDVLVKGQVMTDDCQPLSGINIVGDFYGHPTPLIRSSTVSDSSGYFSVHFQTYPQLKIDTQYFITLRGEYANKTYTWNDDYVFLDDVKKFPFEIDGKSSTAEVMIRNEGSRVVSFELDKDSKKITIVLESNGEGQDNYQIAIPSDLVSGDMIVRKVGSLENPLMLTEKVPFDSVSGPVIDPENDIRHSYFLSASKHDGFAMMGYSDEFDGRATIEVTGTSVIPEFDSVISFVTAVAITSAILAAKQFRNKVK
jgi:hypothetical protein